MKSVIFGGSCLIAGAILVDSLGMVGIILCVIGLAVGLMGLLEGDAAVRRKWEDMK